LRRVPGFGIGGDGLAIDVFYRRFRESGTHPFFHRFYPLADWIIRCSVPLMSGPGRSPTLIVACALWGGVALCAYMISHQAEAGVAVSNPWLIGLNALVLLYLGLMAVRFTLRYRRIACRRVLSAQREEEGSSPE